MLNEINKEISIAAKVGTTTLFVGIMSGFSTITSKIHRNIRRNN